MTNQIALITDQGQVDHALEWLTRLPQLPREDLPERDDVDATVAALSEPCNETWCMARVAALLNPYYDKDTPQAVREMEAEDWLEELAMYPQWAIERAVRWWKSADNKDRRKKPLEGDIAARCKVEMRGIGSVSRLLELKRSGVFKANVPEEPKSPAMTAAQRQETAERILKQAGFAPKRIPEADA